MDLPFLHATLPELIRSVGYVGIFVIVFIESGIPIGLFLPLPGDTLLFSAGLLASLQIFDLIPLIVIITVAAILGDSAGYWLGAHFGPKLFTKENALFMNKQYLVRTERFYAKYGNRAIILARFLPVFRTLAPITAGMGRMEYGNFLRYNIAGAVLWAGSVTMLGYYLGKLIPNIDHYLIPIVLLIALASSLSVVREVLEARKETVETKIRE